MALNVLFVGGTGQISLTSVREAITAGHKVTVFNRGKSSMAEVPAGVTSIVGDIDDQQSYAKLGGYTFDVVCAFMVFRPEQISRDITTFAGKVGQYIFISSASAYQKPARHYIITEKTPLENPYWEYSRLKIACERLLQDQSKLSYTIVRPSHTVRTRLPIQIGDAMTGVRRMLAGKPVLVAGDGTSPCDVDPGHRLLRAVRSTFRQPSGSRRGFPHHQRSRFHLGSDPYGDRASPRRRGEKLSCAERYADPV